MRELEITALVVAAFLIVACSGTKASQPADAGTGEQLSPEISDSVQDQAAKDDLRPAASQVRNVYFGDLHVHSSLSFDAYLFGTRASLDDAYRFARGEALENPVGETLSLSRPLDFAAITDHAEGFGIEESCADAGANEALKTFCQRMDRPDVGFFLELRNSGVNRPPASEVIKAIGDPGAASSYARSTWAKIVEAADAHNDPGQFTSFVAYEYSPALPSRGKLHRNVIFRNGVVPEYAISAFDAASEVDLWRQLNATCETPCDYLTILHNPNRSWGLAFSGVTIDGEVYSEEDWKLREQAEPIVEMYQIKGNSECVSGFGATDELCGFEQFFPPCQKGQETGCIHPTSMARDGLKRGLLMEDDLGFNPLSFGMIGSTDTHNSNPGDTEEYDLGGSSGFNDAPAEVRLSNGPNGPNLVRNPGGLAAVWAEENTRDSLFDAMQRKEVYATSGTRIGLRFFGSYDFAASLLETAQPIETAYRTGVAMGSTLAAPETGTPSFLIWAIRDPLSAPLDRVQIVKGWTENGETFEAVFDVACSNGRTPDPANGRCPPNQADVDLSTCEYGEGSGAGDLRTVWSDEGFEPMQNAFYYARVIENPTCRWSTWDSLRLGRAPPLFPEPTVTEMAWSSPIWVGRQHTDEIR